MKHSELFAYWLALNDEIERDVSEEPDTIEDLKADIKKIEGLIDDPKKLKVIKTRIMKQSMKTPH